MNRTETIQVIAYLAGNYQEIKNKKEDEKEFMITAWLDCLKSYDYQVVMKAVKELMTTSIFIPKVAEIVNLTKEYQKAIIDNTPKLKAGKCDKCKGEGLIYYIKKINGNEYQYASRCSCTKGNEYAYGGTKCQDPRNRSNYYIPSFESLGLGG